MPIEIALSNVKVNAGQVPRPEGEEPFWQLQFTDGNSAVMVSVLFGEPQLHTFASDLVKAIESSRAGVELAPKPRLEVARAIPRGRR